MGMLDGRSAIVTGSSHGIGRAVAFALAAEGAAVVVNGRHDDTVGAAVDELVAAGHTAVGVAGSAARPEVAAALARAALDSTGRIDVLVNCAGAPEPPGSSILTITSEAWHELLDAHLTSTFETCRAAAPHMVERGAGAIVNTSSHAFTGTYGGTGYAAGKGGVNSLTYALAAELREHGVRVNAVCPGARTRLSSGPDYEAQIESLHARGLLDDLLLAGSRNPPAPEHAAALYLYLASDLAHDVSGELLVAAGGYLARFGRPRDEMVTWRDDTAHPPYTPQEIDDLLRAGSA